MLALAGVLAYLDPHRTLAARAVACIGEVCNDSMVGARATGLHPCVPPCVRALHEPVRAPVRALVREHDGLTE
jgi:hypothetical protein